MARAFPTGLPAEKQDANYEPGLSLRQHFAGLVLPMMAKSLGPKEAAKMAVDYAEALIDQLESNK